MPETNDYVCACGHTFGEHDLEEGCPECTCPHFESKKHYGYFMLVVTRDMVVVSFDVNTLEFDEVPGEFTPRGAYDKVLELQERQTTRFRRKQFEEAKRKAQEAKRKQTGQLGAGHPSEAQRSEGKESKTKGKETQRARSRVPRRTPARR